MPKRFNASVVGACFLLAAIVAFIVAQVGYPEITDPQRQDELSKIEASIQLGQHQDDLWILLEDKLHGASQELTEVDKDLWLIKNPLRLGATNWVLVLAFHEGRLVGKGFRIADSLQTSAQGARHDVTEDSFSAE